MHSDGLLFGIHNELPLGDGVIFSSEHKALLLAADFRLQTLGVRKVHNRKFQPLACVNGYDVDKGFAGIRAELFGVLPTGGLRDFLCQPSN